MPIRKGHSGEKCYIGGSLDVGFYEIAFIVRLHMPLTSLHSRLATYMGVSVCQIPPMDGGYSLGLRCYGVNLVEAIDH